MTISIKSITAIACTVLFLSCQQKDAEHTDTAAAGTGSEQEICYLQVTEGQQRVTTEGIKPGVIDSLYIRLHIREGHVTGTMDWLPAEKDRMTGTLDGTIDGNIITAVYTYQAEGGSAREEKIFKLDTNSIWLKTGELIEKDGLWVLKDKKAAFFGQSLPKVRCR